MIIDYRLSALLEKTGVESGETPEAPLNMEYQRGKLFYPIESLCLVFSLIAVGLVTADTRFGEEKLIRSPT